MLPYLCNIIIIFSLIFFPTGKPDLTSDRAALLSLRSAVGGRSLLWNTSSPTPCSWVGVICHVNRVSELHLPGMGLSGKLPSGIFGNLTQLQTLSLRFNALSGGIPPDLASVTGLRNLYLQGNLLSGEIPAFLFTLSNLVRLNLAGNKFSGEISPDVNNVNRLRTLYLENNQLTGSIPELKLPSLNQFNVSHNHLNGSIPSRVAKMPASAFEGNSLCGGPFESCFPNQEGKKKKKKKKLSGGAIAGIVIGSVFALLLLLLILFLCCRKKKNNKTGPRDISPVKLSEVEIPNQQSNVEDGLRGGGGGGGAALVAKDDAKIGGGVGSKKLVFFGNAPRNFDLEDLLRASAEVLGKGTFGTAYKAVLEVGTVVGVKRLKDVAVSEKEFREKIELVGGLNHLNLVLLRAYYYSRDEKLLVYDYMPMGSLSALLHGNRGSGRPPLDWESRFVIALGAARGIAFIHRQGPTSSHGNIKSSNILLTENNEARVSDFGLAHLVGPTSTPNRIAGYRAPEVTDARKISQKADVYSFGVLLLELLTGKAPTHALLNEEGVDLPRWVQSVVREEWTSEVFDLELLRYQNVEEDMVQILQLAINCTAQYPDNRPSMDEVTHQMEEIGRSYLKKEQEDVSGNQVNDTEDVDSLAPPPSSVDAR